MEFNDFLLNKNVILIGPASYLLGENRGEEIDEYDVVVRLNHIYKNMIVRYSKDIGSKIDILYHHMNPKVKPCMGKKDIDYFKEKGLKYIVSREDIEHPYFKIFLNKEYNVPIISAGHIEKIISKELNTLSSMGIIAITHLLSFSIKSLSVIGFDFYQSGYLSGYKNVIGKKSKNFKPSVLHQMPPQISYLKKIYKQDDRLKLDTVLIDILREKEDILI